MNTQITVDSSFNSETAGRLIGLADDLDAQSQQIPNTQLGKLEAVVDAVGRSWSGSWLGYQSRVYYENLSPVPPGARFSTEWGLMGTFSAGETIGDWFEFNFEDVICTIKEKSGIRDLQKLKTGASKAAALFDDIQSQSISLLFAASNEWSGDKFISDQMDKIKALKVFAYEECVSGLKPSMKFVCRDMIAVQAGLLTPPHLSVLAESLSIRSTYVQCGALAKLVRRVASHLEILSRRKTGARLVGTHVFIGHGRSNLWRDLKDFIQDRLSLPWDEFNRVPVAGFSNITRLSQMLDSAAIAFLVLTAEDEQSDGNWHARMNVVHEAGLFQGRLGFEKAIILLEDGCEEFSNVQGLGQIRFPKGDISRAFEEIRRVLEREGIV